MGIYFRGDGSLLFDSGALAMHGDCCCGGTCGCCTGTIKGFSFTVTGAANTDNCDECEDAVNRTICIPQVDPDGCSGNIRVEDVCDSTLLWSYAITDLGTGNCRMTMRLFGPLDDAVNGTADFTKGDPLIACSGIHGDGTMSETDESGLDPQCNYDNVVITFNGLCVP